MADKRTPVCIKFFDSLNYWSICHMGSQQPAFGSKVNRFSTARKAIDFAKDNGCEITLIVR